jgi:AraC-like DNA-binding protein
LEGLDLIAHLMDQTLWQRDLDPDWLLAAAHVKTRHVNIDRHPKAPGEIGIRCEFLKLRGLRQVHNLARELRREVDLAIERGAQGNDQLDRRLSAAGTTFQQVLDHVRCVVAKELLEDSRMTISDISGALGYTADVSFIRAFRRWTGTTPGAWRKSPR